MHRFHCSGSGKNGTESACSVPSLASLAQDVLPGSGGPPECSFYSAVRAPSTLHQSTHWDAVTSAAVISAKLSPAHRSTGTNCA